MSTVRADNLCPIYRTIWQCFESEFAVHKSFLHFLSLSLYSPPCFSKTPALLLLPLIPFLILLPPSGSSLQVPQTAVNHTMRVSFLFLIPSINRTLKKHNGFKRMFNSPNIYIDLQITAPGGGMLLTSVYFQCMESLGTGICKCSQCAHVLDDDLTKNIIGVDVNTYLLSTGIRYIGV